MARSSSARTWSAQVRTTWSAAAAGWEHWEAFHLHYLAPVNTQLVRSLAPAPGQRLLDVACGTGEPTLELARWVAPRGEVVGVDVAAPMLAVARRRGRALAIRNVRFVRAGAESLPQTLGRFDGVTSRFGLMFVEDVESTLASLRGLLKPGGHAAFAVWGTPARNPFFTLLNDGIRDLLPEPPDPARTPHPFRLSRAGRLAQLMRKAGFRAIDSHDVPLAATFPDAKTWYAAAAATSSMLQSALAKVTARERDRIEARLTARAAEYVSGHAIRIPGFAWVVSGRR